MLYLLYLHLLLTTYLAAAGRSRSRAILTIPTLTTHYLPGGSWKKSVTCYTYYTYTYYLLLTWRQLEEVAGQHELYAAEGRVAPGGVITR